MCGKLRHLLFELIFGLSVGDWSHLVDKPLPIIMRLNYLKTSGMKAKFSMFEDFFSLATRSIFVVPLNLCLSHVLEDVLR